MKLPEQNDFYTSELDLDGPYAWKHFGGLTIEEAYARFCEKPETYQEDFMFMGGRAFAFYFPVIDKYIREKELLIAFSKETRILCEGMRTRFKCRFVKDIGFRQKTYQEIISLCRFILDSINTPNVKAIEKEMKLHLIWNEYGSLPVIKELCSDLLAEVERARGEL